VAVSNFSFTDRPTTVTPGEFRRQAVSRITSCGSSF
jgi:hypothetical protein